jgi:hypothetical protein
MEFYLLQITEKKNIDLLFCSSNFFWILCQSLQSRDEIFLIVYIFTLNLLDMVEKMHNRAVLEKTKSVITFWAILRVGGTLFGFKVWWNDK